jgi:hypothetical protein
MTNESGHRARRNNQRPGITLAGRLLAFASLFSGLSCIAAQQAPASTPALASAPPKGQPAASTQSPPVPATLNTGQPILGNSADREKAILGHLNAALRFYHDSEAPIQKVGEPSDLIYRDQTATLSTQIAALAFQSAKAETALMAKVGEAAPNASSAQTQAQKLQAFRDGVTQRIAQLKTQDAALEKQLETARPRDLASLKEQREQTQGELELQTAMQDALGRITNISNSAGETGFAAQIVQLERSAPALATGKAAAVSPTLENLGAARSAGVTSQAQVLFSLLGTKQSIENLSKEADALNRQATEVRTPLINALKATIAQGEALSQQFSSAAPATPASASAQTTTAPPAAKAPSQQAVSATDITATRKNFDTLTASFKALSAASVPLSQEIAAIEQSQAGLQAWHRAVTEEYTSILWSLLARVMGIAIALLVIFVLGEVWRRATTKYIHDIRRRRQILVIRRLVIGFLSGLVMIFGLVTQFSSLATFAGFITAGLAVGLQTILLSVAAYFFIIGRYGVRVGDRITIAGVTGDVAEVGLVRFYVMELAGSGTDLYASGRVAVFSNAVLFQAGTPLFKQLPGTEYLWHELTVKLTPDGDYRHAVQAMLNTVQDVYNGYRPLIEQQHQQLESWMDSSFDSPAVQSSLQLVDAGLQFWARFPVLIRQTADTDDRMTESLLETIASDPKVKAAVGAPPVIKAAVKG